MNDLLEHQSISLSIPTIASNVQFNIHQMVFYVLQRGYIIFEKPVNSLRFRSYLDLENDFQASFYRVAISMPHLFSSRKAESRKPTLFFNHINEKNVRLLMAVMCEQIGQTYIDIEMCHITQFFRNCDFHLVDLYEMGYFSSCKIPSEIGEIDVFTGLDFVASALHDTVEVNVSTHIFHMMFYFQTTRNKRLTAQVNALLDELPFREEDYRQELKDEWEVSNILEIQNQDLFEPEFMFSNHNHYWWIKKLNKILDYFDQYHMYWNFYAHVIPDEIYFGSSEEPPPSIVEVS